MHFWNTDRNDNEGPLNRKVMLALSISIHCLITFVISYLFERNELQSQDVNSHQNPMQDSCIKIPLSIFAIFYSSVHPSNIFGYVNCNTAWSKVGFSGGAALTLTPMWSSTNIQQ